MIIDTEKLHENMTKYYEERSRNIDKNIKNDQLAIKMFTRLEEQQMKDEKIIENIIELAEKYFR